MKYLFSLINIFFISLSFYGQNDIISDITESKFGVVSANKMNVVYRGIRNQISIAVPNCKSFTASGLGLEKVNEKDYILSPGVGLESMITLDILLIDGSLKKEIHKFRIKNISHSIAKINNTNCVNCIVEMTREELKDAEISIQINDLLIDFNIQKVKSFYIHFPNKRSYKVMGHKIDIQSYNIIKKLKIGSLFTIDNVEHSDRIEGCFSMPYPIKIMIAPPSINYYQSRKFIKDSLNNLKGKYHKKQSRN